MPLGPLRALEAPDVGADAAGVADVEVEGVDVGPVHVVPEGEAGGRGLLQAGADQPRLVVQPPARRLQVDVVPTWIILIIIINFTSKARLHA